MSVTNIGIHHRRISYNFEDTENLTEPFMVEMFQGEEDTSGDESIGGDEISRTPSIEDHNLIPANLECAYFFYFVPHLFYELSFLSCFMDVRLFLSVHLIKKAEFGQVTKKK